LIHDPETAGYSWEVIRGRMGEALQISDRTTLPSRTPLQGWITGDAAAKLLRMAGHDLDRLVEDAASGGFTAVELDMIGTAHLDTTVRPVRSYNVVGEVEGSDPQRADEYILFVAHWDHLGIGEAVDGDDIYNGAIDNAIGTAALLEVAAAWASMEPTPRRSALFIASTAEESGFLGVNSYIENPVVPLAKTLAAINIDGVNVFGPTEDVWIVGPGLTTLEEELEAVLAAGGRRLSPDPAPEQGNFFRSDHFPFALAGVPALCVRPGMTFIDQPDGFGTEVWKDYYSNRYHRPSDEFDDSWDFDATAEDVEVMLEVALRVSEQEVWPEWYPGTSYGATRDAMLQSATP
jgi:Zn-dependent M28 family amino/carboxypeptidase